MSLAQIQEELTKLTPAELKQLLRTIDDRLSREKAAVTGEMLQRRRDLADKFMSGEYGADSPSWQETRAHDKKKDSWKP
jgi:hypothetical protein